MVQVGCEVDHTGSIADPVLRWRHLIGGANALVENCTRMHHLSLPSLGQRNFAHCTIPCDDADRLDESAR